MNGGKEVKKIFIKDLVEYVGEEITETFFVRDFVNNHNRQGTLWTAVHIVDKTGSAAAKIWSEFSKEQYELCEGNICKITGKVDIYNGMVGIAISKITPVQNYELADYTTELSIEQKETLQKELFAWIEQVKDRRYQSLLKNIFSKNQEKVFSAPASTKMHHAFNGGMIKHTLEVVKIAVDIAETYGFNIQKENVNCEINKDLLISAALLHDIGCITSYELFPLARMTTRGHLVGIAQESCFFVISYNSLQKEEEKIKDTSDLIHCILAAHSDEMGKNPLTLEAMILKDANEASIHADGYGTFFEHDYRVHPSSKERRFAYSSMHGRMLYRRAEV